MMMSQIASEDLSRMIRSEDIVMAPERIGALHQSRLSFSRMLIRQMVKEKWEISKEYLHITDLNEGEALYRVKTPHGVYSFVVFAHNIPPEARTDRAIAKQWDYTFALTEGYADDHTIERLRENVPKQGDGRYVSRDIVFGRGNKSGRIFDYIVEKLANGEQPEAKVLVEVSYLIRTSAVFGNGKFGIADFARLLSKGPFVRPYAAQMLLVYLVRLFSIDAVHHLAKARNASLAVELISEIQRFLGVGNATGLGMVPFLLGHPKLLDKWIVIREQALATVKSRQLSNKEEVLKFQACVSRAILSVSQWNTKDLGQQEKIDVLLKELQDFKSRLTAWSLEGARTGGFFWRTITDFAFKKYSLETQEFINSLILEPHGNLIDCLEDEAVVSEDGCMNARMTLEELKRKIESEYSWALAIDVLDKEEKHFFWYRSLSNREPRIGVRGVDLGVEKELNVGIAVQVVELYRTLEILGRSERHKRVGKFLLDFPEYRFIVGRIQGLSGCRYGEIRENLLSKKCSPLNILRGKLALLGATRFDPKSNQWIRVTFFQGAPLPGENSRLEDDDEAWFLPYLEEVM